MKPGSVFLYTDSDGNHFYHYVFAVTKDTVIHGQIFRTPDKKLGVMSEQVAPYELMHSSRITLTSLKIPGIKLVNRKQK